MPSLFTELRRRNVFKVGAAYAIVAWLLVQVVDVVLPALQMPEWTISFVTVLLIIGFPITLIIAWAFDVTPQGIKSASEAGVGDVPAQPTALRFGYISQGLILLAVGFLVVDQYVLERSPTEAETGESIAPPAVSGESSPARRYELGLGGATRVLGNSQLGAHLALSRDGRRLVYAADLGDQPRLYLRELDQFDARAIPGTEGAYHPFFSPDGEWVGFYSDETDGKLKTVPIREGSPLSLADAIYSSGASWADDDFIVFSTRDQAGGRSLYRIGTAGGTPELILEANDQEGYVSPEVLPGSEAVLVVVRPGVGGGGSASDGSIALLSLATRESRTLILGGYRPRYAATGHVIFVRGGDLWAVPFDLDRLETSGREVRVVQNIQQGGFEGGAAYTISGDGVLMYLPGGEVSGIVERTMVWVDRQGNIEPLAAEVRQYSNPRISPDGQQLAVSVLAETGPDVWIYDFVRETISRLTFGRDSNRPTWTPDGQNVVFRSFSGPIFRRAANGSGQRELFSSALSADGMFPLSFSPDGSEFVVQSCEGLSCDLLLLSRTDEDTLEPLLSEDFGVNDGAISPDGKWLAYGAFTTGRGEIYVRPFPNVEEGPWQISSGGGSEPRWAPLGGELFYRDADSVFAVTYETEPTFRAGSPTILFRGNRYSSGANVLERPSYDVAPDGQRFLMLRDEISSEQDSSNARLNVVENWFEELNRLAPPSP